jgi:hypothetical protein
MAGKGMGAATAGGGCIEKGPKNKMVKGTSKTTGPVFLANGGAITKAIAGAAKNTMNKMMSSKAPTPPTAAPTKGGMLSSLRGSRPSMMMAEGGDVSPRKRMAMGMKDGGCAKKMKKGGSC